MTFDDVPKSSYTLGGELLARYGFRATFYLSMSLMDGSYSIGPAFSRSDLDGILRAGHEIGCHTYGHNDAWETVPDIFEASIMQNQRKLSELFPDKSFNTFSYPINSPHPKIKQRVENHYICARAGGQFFNTARVDLNQLNGYFIDKRNRDNFGCLAGIISENCRHNGWLIFCTHDISENPSPYGCTPKLFDELIRAVYTSGATVLPVNEACALLGVEGT